MLYAEKYESRSSAAVTAAIRKALGITTVRGIMQDNGSEFARHRKIETHYNAPVFFADPRPPWQRGTSENTNGLLRFSLSKGTDFGRPRWLGSR
jgi:IS30 family transposase